MKPFGPSAASTSMLVVLAMSAALSGCHSASSIQLAPNKPVLVESSTPLVLPNVVALDSDGNALDEAPPVTFMVEPAGLVNIENGKIIPLKNGKGTLKAIAEDLPEATLPLEVLVVEELKAQCPEPCEIHTGESTELKASAVGLGSEEIKTGFTWTSSDPGRATVDANGKVTAVAPGPVVILAKLGKKSAEATVLVRPAVDEVRLVCATPPMLVRVKKGQAAETLERSCDVAEGDDTTVGVSLWSNGQLVEGERIEWKTSDPSVRVLNGLVTGDHVGGGMVQATAAGITAEMPVSVQKVKKLPPACPTEDARFEKETPIAMKLANAAGDPFEKTVAYKCTNDAAAKCLDDVSIALIPIVNKLQVDLKGIESFAISVLDSRGQHCCCKR
jgi:hypothetical protein